MGASVRIPFDTPTGASFLVPNEKGNAMEMLWSIFPLSLKGYHKMRTQSKHGVRFPEQNHARSTRGTEGLSPAVGFPMKFIPRA